MYRVLVSSTFQKEYVHLDPESQSRIRNALEQLQKIHSPHVPMPI